MIRFSKIVFPTDFSKSAGRALPHALELARRFKTELVMIHVRTPFGDDPNRPEERFFDEGRYADFVAAQLKETIAGLPANTPVRSVHLRDVSAAAAILRFIDENLVDLVVMGTHGRSGAAHLFLGSVAEKVARHAVCPVLTVGGRGEQYRSNPVYQKILLGFDFSQHSKEAARKAYGLAKAFDARLDVLYVLEQQVSPAYFDIWRMSIGEDLPDLEERARKALEKALGGEGLPDVAVHVEVGEGDGKAHRHISRFAEKQGTDLIVVGTHGLSGFEHVLLGSTTEKVIRIAPCPVMTFHLAPVK